jgi:hypothetical protein
MDSAVVSFALKADLSPADELATWGAVAWVRGVVRVIPLAPDAILPELRRMGSAIVDPSVDTQLVADSIEALSGIEYADVSADRGL